MQIIGLPFTHFKIAYKDLSIDYIVCSTLLLYLFLNSSLYSI